ncbi:ABC transporter permease [Helicobacter sp. 11S02596-1]|uniref:ABC transporter permease n=1 Tax=Helicobacter sp. 11S02596-1 TaxID=1476194 RepID=UPI000BA53D7D|nr:ABC transporter permease [Helicobacter sp. 11S02596-1]PAF45098.1 hypothetical protein BJI48_00575 [Helicobacter sp. 11S02596-1]
MSFFAVLFKEFKAIFTNISVVFVVVIGSLLYAFLYPSPYRNDILDSQKIAVVDRDNTSLSKKLIFLVQATPQVDVKAVFISMKEAKNLLEKDEIGGILEIPQRFESNVYRGIPSRLDYFANASYFLIYGAVIDGILNASNELSNQIKHQKILLEKDRGHQNTPQDSELIQPNAIPLYNPSAGYINYALAAILVFILHQTMIAGAGILGASQNQKNLLIQKNLQKNTSDQKNIEENLQTNYFYLAPAVKLVLARITAFSMIYIVFFIFYFGFLFQFYGVHIGANIISFWCFALMFILCCASFGVLFGLLLSRPALPTQIVLITSLPLVFMMGFIWPLDLIPAPIVFLAHFIPAFHGIAGFVQMNQMGAPLLAVMGHFYWLAALCVVATSLSIMILKHKKQHIGVLNG